MKEMPAEGIQGNVAEAPPPAIQTNSRMMKDAPPEPMAVREALPERSLSRGPDKSMEMKGSASAKSSQDPSSNVIP